MVGRGRKQGGKGGKGKGGKQSLGTATRKAPTKKDRADPKFDHAGRLEVGVDSFYDPGNSLARLCGYVGFENTGELRKFLLSRPMLAITSEIISQGLHKQVKWADVFEELRGTIEQCGNNTDEIDKKFGVQVDLLATYPDVGTKSERQQDSAKESQHKTNRYCRMAALIWQLKNAIETYKDDDATRNQGLDIVRTRFETLIGIPSNQNQFHIPEVNVDEISFPELGPFDEFYETFMEPYNRVYHLYSYLYYCSTPSRWKYFLQSDANKTFDYKEIGAEYTPLFMRERPASEPEIEKLNTQERRRLQPKEFTYKWLQALDDPEGKEHIESKRAAAMLTGTLECDPRILEDWELRDQIRTQFSFATGGLQLEKLLLSYVTKDGEEMKINIMASPWEDDVLPILTYEKSCCFLFGVRLLSHGEKLLEQENTPSAIVDLVHITSQGEPEFAAPPDSADQSDLEDDNWIEDEAEVKTGGTGFVREIHKSGRRIPYETPLSLFPKGKKDKERVLHYSGIDTASEQGLKEWQGRALRKLSSNLIWKTGVQEETEMKTSDAMRLLTDELQAAVAEESLDINKISPETLNRMCTQQAAFTGTKAQLGPDIQDAMLALGFESVNTPAGQIPRCRSLFLELGKNCFPFEYQINALAHILGNLFGYIPTNGLPKEHLDKPEVKAALKRLRRCPLSTTLLCDLPGIGKTMAFLMAALWTASFGPPDEDDEGNTIYRPTLLTVPRSVVLQLCGVISLHFPKFTLIVSYSEHQEELGRFIVKPSQIQNLKTMPGKFLHVFKQKDPRAAFGLIVTTYGALVRRVFFVGKRITGLT